ncbi:hypothetical protein [Hymenobacter saemangeumensis]
MLEAEEQRIKASGGGSLGLEFVIIIGLANLVGLLLNLGLSVRQAFKRNYALALIYLAFVLLWVYSNQTSGTTGRLVPG